MDSISRVMRAFLNGFGWKLGAALAVALLALASNAFGYGLVTASSAPGYCGTWFNGATVHCASSLAARAADYARSIDAANYNFNRTYYRAESAVSSPGAIDSVTGEVTANAIVHTTVYNIPSGTVYTEADQGVGGVLTAGAGSSCPSNSTQAAGGNCVCNLGFRGGAFNGSGAAASCSPYSCSASAGAGFVSETRPTGVVGCEQRGVNEGCASSEAYDGFTVGAGGTKSYLGHTVYTGAACQEGGSSQSPENPPPKEPVPPHEATNAEKCALGRGVPLCAGTINGASVCVSCTASESTSTEKATTPAGAASAPQGITDGTKTTIVECQGLRCTSSTTYKDAAGSTVGSVSGGAVSRGAGGGGGGSEPGLCSEYPNIPACKFGTFTGSCSAGAATIACDGDGVQCAIARDQFKRSCEFFERTGDETAVANAAKANGVAGDSDHPAKNPTSISLGSFDQTDLLPGSCPADRSLMIGAATVALPFSKVCTPASQLGSLLVALTALACVAIVFKGG